jgi:hypothetical protein
MGASTGCSETTGAGAGTEGVVHAVTEAERIKENSMMRVPWGISIAE